MASILGSDLRLQGGIEMLLLLLLRESPVGVRRNLADLSRSCLTGRGDGGSSSVGAWAWLRKQLNGMVGMDAFEGSRSLRALIEYCVLIVSYRCQVSIGLVK